MKYIDWNVFESHYKPIKNPYFPVKELNSTLFEPDRLAQIAGFIGERKLWSLIYRDRVIVLDSGETKREYFIIPGCQKLNVVGYFVTSLSYEDNAIEVKMS